MKRSVSLNPKIIPWVLFATTLLFFFATNFDGAFVLDDHYQVEQNPFIRSVTSLPRLLTTRLWASTSLEAEGSDIYRPVLMTSYLFDVVIFGIRTFWMHFHNDFLHALNVVLFWFLCRSFFPVSLSLFLSSLFAFHPMVTDAVTWIGGRMELQYALAALVLAHLVRLYLESEKTSWKLPLLISLCSVIGLFSKEPFAPLPFLILAATAFYTAPNDYKRRRIVLLMSVLTGTLSLAFLWRQSVVDRSVQSLLSPIVVTNARSLITRFLGLLVVPSDSEFFLRYLPSGSFAIQDAAFLAILAVLTLVMLIRPSTRGQVLLGLGFFLGPLAVVSLVLDLTGFLSERYFYFPLCGFLLLGGRGLMSLQAKSQPSVSEKGRRFIEVAAVLLVLSLAVLTALRNREWRHERTLYLSSISRDPASPDPYFFLAHSYSRDGMREKEIESYFEVLKRDPNHLRTLNNLAVRMVELGKFSEAEQLLTRALRIAPTRAKTAYNFGFLYEMQGNRPAAIKWYSRAAKDPSYTRASTALQRLRGR